MGGINFDGAVLKQIVGWGGGGCPNFGKPWTHLACCRGPGCTSHFAFLIYLELVSASLDAIKADWC